MSDVVDKKAKEDRAYIERLSRELKDLDREGKEQLFFYSCVQICKEYLEEDVKSLSMDFGYNVRGKPTDFVVTIKRKKESNECR